MEKKYFLFNIILYYCKLIFSYINDLLFLPVFIFYSIAPLDLITSIESLFEGFFMWARVHKYILSIDIECEFGNDNLLYYSYRRSENPIVYIPYEKNLSYWAIVYFFAPGIFTVREECLKSLPFYIRFFFENINLIFKKKNILSSDTVQFFIGKNDDILNNFKNNATYFKKINKSIIIFSNKTKKKSSYFSDITTYVRMSKKITATRDIPLAHFFTLFKEELAFCQKID